MHSIVLGENHEKTVIFLHGWGGGASAFLFCAERLKEEFRCVLVDFPGFGESAEPPVPWTVGDYAAEVCSLADSLGAAEFALVGHSFGGRVALEIAAKQYEDRKYEGYYNVGPDDCDCVTTGELTDLFCQAWGGVSWINRYDGGPHEASFLKLDCSHIKKVFGWRPRYGVKEAVEKTVEWSKAYFRGENMLEVTDRQIQEFFRG